MTDFNITVEILQDSQLSVFMELTSDSLDINLSNFKEEDMYYSSWAFGLLMTFGAYWSISAMWKLLNGLNNLD